MDKLIIATRASDLALWQAYHVKARIEASFPETKVELNIIVSNGDKVLDKPLALIGGKGHFTKELEDAMLNGEAHMAVHSLKDVPTYIPEGLELCAITQRQDQSDVFLSHKYKSLKDLPKGSVVGTTSLRRRMQLLKKRPDLIVKDLRGNVNTRLRKLAEGQYDAIILAYIGLHRLDLLKDIPFTKKLKLKNMIPPMGQAALGIEIVASNDKVREIAMSLNDQNTYLCTMLERDFISKIGAGCSAPVACNATISDDGSIVDMEVMIGFPDGTNIMHVSATALTSKCDHLGEQLANDCIQRGAMEILENASKIAFKDEMPQRL
ncbi:MAG: hydroxymethylbilane synthase [Campylobacteraceae bacterium]|jgi:hydroxymethylbilane synthase|nr:hydroxymethylbilane synthase [Campylobacteraceae bacterium]MBT3883068.1 hydroxymethylbilane synthase [Campylobacteraceae bacterium]MBT4030728.1 hydroxymethylbilane synthase [Campylobacteraceae bacterium]MBT4178583.1 hydroxymethylbilane synthase [Campylobacteraceae bacterium]MBT4572699.1 hydroxymethylbilane synthase [Campylobacteraceae bacterium]